MFTVYDVHVELRVNPSQADVSRLKDHFKALAMNTVGLDRDSLKPRTNELTFSIYGSVGPFIMKRLVQECTQSIFPGSAVVLSDSR